MAEKKERVKRPRSTATLVATFDLSINRTSREVLEKLFKDWATVMRACFYHKTAGSRNYFYKVPEIVDLVLKVGFSDGIAMTVFGNAIFHIHQCFRMQNYKFRNMFRWPDYVVKLFQPHWEMRDNNLMLLDLYRPDKGRPQFAMQIKGYDEALDLNNKASFIGISHDVGSDDYYVKFYTHPKVDSPETPPPLVCIKEEPLAHTLDDNEQEPLMVTSECADLVEPTSIQDAVKATATAMKKSRRKARTPEVS